MGYLKVWLEERVSVLKCGTLTLYISPVRSNLKLSESVQTLGNEAGVIKFCAISPTSKNPIKISEGSERVVFWYARAHWWSKINGARHI